MKNIVMREWADAHGIAHLDKPPVEDDGTADEILGVADNVPENVITAIVGASRPYTFHPKIDIWCGYRTLKMSKFRDWKHRQLYYVDCGGYNHLKYWTEDGQPSSRYEFENEDDREQWSGDGGNDLWVREALRMHEEAL